jgi:hypothetical protein
VPKDDVPEKRQRAIYLVLVAEVAPNLAEAHAMLIDDLQPALEPIAKYFVVDIIVSWSILFHKLFNVKVVGVKNLSQYGENCMMARRSILLNVLRYSCSRRGC